ncbi:hypothetical protein RFI_25947 [Reticulomyxa filosa]|uniref:Uncharacterized protein n=1 Tax=Reticulomyxa filosa TaxID=46433 RepID=X6MC55_RETFI|nr:hypothetical protein RFI_25947 [Reticulomyxa filosa]|eukprot:ETO11429.1 hypothetical protein RFI_25947 [Reticulomyxa filosa]
MIRCKMKRCQVHWIYGHDHFVDQHKKQKASKLVVVFVKVSRNVLEDDFSRGEKRDSNSIIDRPMTMVEEILQVRNNSKKRIYLSCVIIFVCKQNEISLDETKKAIEREREEEAEVNKNEDENEDEKAGHGRAKSTVANFFDMAVGNRVRILGNKTCVMSYLDDVEFSNEENLWQVKKPLISVEFCFNVRKQTDGSNDDEDYTTPPPQAS